MGTVSAPEKGLIGRRLRYVLFIIVLAGAVTEFYKYFHLDGWFK
jgi:hypothetical protein